MQDDYSFELEVLLIYGAFCIVRLALAYVRLLPTWMLYLSVIADMALLMGLIYSFHYKYAQPAVFYLKVPTLLYVFLFIALRALRFEARFVMFTGLTAVAGWIGLILYAARRPRRAAQSDRRLRRVHDLERAAGPRRGRQDHRHPAHHPVLALAISRARHLLVRRSAKAPRRATCRASSIPASRPASARRRCRSRRAKANCATSPS